jgi:hypothetical protein
MITSASRREGSDDSRHDSRDDSDDHAVLDLDFLLGDDSR